MQPWFFFLFLVGMILGNTLPAMTCPPPPTEDNPIVLPDPWRPYVFSVDPQYEKGIRFVNVQIPPKAVSSVNGVICTYHSPSYGNYSIWQQKIAKKARFSTDGQGCPACNDYWFSDKRRGDTCSESIEKCTFLILETSN